jgi:hypothetical protein
MLALRAVVFAIVMAVMFWLLSPLEHRRLPWWDAPTQVTGARSVAAGALVCVAGIALVFLAKNGLDEPKVLRDARMPFSSPQRPRGYVRPPTFANRLSFGLPDYNPLNQ